MSFISPSNQKQIQALDVALEDYIKDPSAKKLSSIQQQLKNLLGNPQIPDSVKQSLQAALNQLKQATQGDLTDFAKSAKMQVDAFLSQGESEGMQGGSGEQQVGGGSLGGGGGGEG